MNATLEFDLTRMNELMRRMVHELRLSRDEVLKTQSALLGERLIAFTPPKTKSIGLRAVKKSINKVAKVPNPNFFKKEWIRDAIKSVIRKRDYDGLRLIAQRITKTQDWKAEPFTPNMHIQARSMKTHSVRYSQKRWSLNGIEIANYIKEIQSHVGRLRAKWTPFLTYGGRTAAAWIDRHKSVAEPIMVSENSGEKTVAVRSSGYGIMRLADRFRDAVNTRNRDMEKSLRVQLRLMKRKLSL